MKRTDPSKSAIVRVPEALADVSFVKVADACLAAGIGQTQFYTELKAGHGPKLYRFGPRCTRLLLSDVRAWLVERAQRGAAAEQTAAFTVMRASKAGAAAQAARRASTGSPSTTGESNEHRT